MASIPLHHVWSCWTTGPSAHELGNDHERGELAAARTPNDGAGLMSRGTLALVFALRPDGKTMALNIKTMSAGQLLTLRNDIDMRLQQMAAELEKQLVEIKGLTFPKRRGRRPGSTNSLKGRRAEPKYQNPADPSQTWAGRGMKPRWLTAAMKGGKKLESFAIRK